MVTIVSVWCVTALTHTVQYASCENTPKRKKRELQILFEATRNLECHVHRFSEPTHLFPPYGSANVRPHPLDAEKRTPGEGSEMWQMSGRAVCPTSQGKPNRQVPVPLHISKKARNQPPSKLFLWNVSSDTAGRHDFYQAVPWQVNTPGNS